MPQKLDPPIDPKTTADLYDQLERLDRQWLIDCDHFAVRGNRGWPTLPRLSHSLLSAFFACGAAAGVTAAVFLAAPTTPSTPRITIAVTGAAITLILAAACLPRILKAAAYESALASYEAKRKSLTSRLGLSRNDGRLDYANFNHVPNVK